MQQETIEATAPGTGNKEETFYCTRCIFDNHTPSIHFDAQGVCNYCHMVDGLERQYATGTPAGEAALQRILDEIKAKGKGKQYDCVVGVSGGTDSSYMLARAVEWGLRPLAVLYDNTWNSAIATENIRKVTSALKIDLFTIVVDNKESDDIFKSFFLAGVPELDCATDIAIAETLYRAAAKFGVGYILEGHSFRTEGVAPLGNNYFDGQYVKSVHRQYGKGKLKTFPNMDFGSFMKWVLVKRIKKIRPYWFMEYSKAGAREYLEDRFGWQYYGGHHLENRLTAFLHTVWYPQKFGYDARSWSLSAAVRSGHMSREEALAIYQQPIVPDAELVAYFKKRLGLTEAEYESVLQGPNRNYRQFKTYKQRFERLRPMFWVLAKLHLVPMSFYIKYTAKAPDA